MATKLRTAFRKTFFGLLVLGSVVIIGTSTSNTVYAQQLTSRGLRIGTSERGTATEHTFTFSYTSSDAVGSIEFRYCTDPFVESPCTAPSGLDASGAILSSQSGEQGFTLSATTANTLVLTRAAVSPTQNPSEYTFNNIINPTGTPDTFYVRISTHAALDASDANIDFGAVVNSTTTGVQISSEVPPILKFCVGLTLDNDCTTADESVIDLGDLSSARVAAGSSQMLAATNADFGLAIAVFGTTMTSGNNTIPALSVPTVSAPGNAQFGLNLRHNTDPLIGQEPVGPGITVPTSGYNTANKYAFVSGDVVATSSDATDTRKFTASYIVNVPPGQQPGVYTATLTYVCVATF